MTVNYGWPYMSSNAEADNMEATSKPALDAVDAALKPIDTRTTMTSVTGITGVDALVDSIALRKVGEVAWLKFKLNGTWTPPGTWTGKLLMTLPPSARPVDLAVVAPLQFTTCWLAVSPAGAVDISSGPGGTGFSGTYDVRLNWITV